MRITIQILFTVLTAFSVTITATSAEECLTLAGDFKTVTSVKLFHGDVEKVFRKAGFCSKTIDLPVKRIEFETRNGNIDADFFRTPPYVARMSDYAVKIPTPAFTIKGVVLTLSSEFRPRTLKDINEARIGYVHGFKWHAVIAKDIANTYKGRTNEELIDLMKKGDIQGFLSQDFSIRQFIKKGLLKESEIHMSEPIMDLPLYIVLPKKNEKLIGKLDAALQDVLKEGGFRLK